MPLFCFISGYFSKKLEKRQRTAFENLFIPFVVGQIVLGFMAIIINHNLSIIKNPLYAQYGTWYLIALFIWRILMPDLVKVKHIRLLSIALFFLTPFFWGIDNTLGLQRVLGFFCFFLAGYFANKYKIDKIHKIPHWLCVSIFLFEMIALYTCFTKLHISYKQVFTVFVHGLTISKEIWNIPFVILSYIIAFGVAVLNSYLFLNLFYAASNKLAKIGEDTMPLYLSHLVMVQTYAATMRMFSDEIYILFSVPVGIAMIVGLSSKNYRNWFNKSMKAITWNIMKSE